MFDAVVAFASKPTSESINAHYDELRAILHTKHTASKQKDKERKNDMEKQQHSKSKQQQDKEEREKHKANVRAHEEQLRAGRENARALGPMLRFLFEHVKSPEFQMRHRWQDDSVVFLDNRCAQHYAVPDYHERRILHRVTIKGDRPF